MKILQKQMADRFRSLGNKRPLAQLLSGMISLLAASFPIFAQSQVGTHPPVKIVIPEDAGHGLPLVAPLDRTLESGRYRLKTENGNKSYTAEICNDRLISTQLKSAAKATPETFALHREKDKAKSAFHWKAEAGDLILQHDGRQLFHYNFAIDEPPEDVNPLYRRSGYLHPILSPAGRVLTEAFPADHLHQHGLFTAWVNTTVSGEQIDFWNQAKAEATVTHIQKLDQWAGDLSAGLKVKLAHQLVAADQPASTVLEETWQLTALPCEEVHVWEWESLQTNVTEEPVELNQYHYGGYAIRGPSRWLEDGKSSPRAGFLTSSGKNRKEGNHQPARWVAMFGPSSDDRETARSGVVLMSHPRNLRAPQKARLHPSKPYFCFCPVIDAPYTIKPGESLQARFLVVTFDGEVPVEKLEKIWTDFSSPIKAKLLENPK